MWDMEIQNRTNQLITFFMLDRIILRCLVSFQVVVFLASFVGDMLGWLLGPTQRHLDIFIFCN